MISNQDLLYENIYINNTNNIHIIQAIIFIISLIVFNSLFKNDEVRKTEKAEVAKQYLKQYENENEEFFFGINLYLYQFINILYNN